MGKFTVHRCDWCAYEETEPKVSGTIVNVKISVPGEDGKSTPLEFDGDLCGRCRAPLQDAVRMARRDVPMRGR